MAIAVALLAACTPDVVEQPVEVAPSVIDRRDADEPEGDEPEADDPEDVDEDDTADETEADDAADDAADDTTDAADDATDDADDAPAATPPTTSTPAPTPAPAEPTPDPLVLSAGPAVSTGLTWHSDGTDWTEASSVVLVAGDDPDPFVVRLQPVADDGRAATRGARCQVTLTAPADRDLVVRGEITVAVVIDTADGGTVQRTRQRVHVDAVIAAGEELELPVSTPAQVQLADADRAIACGADLS